jgi:hypothetical protein
LVEIFVVPNALRPYRRASAHNRLKTAFFTDDSPDSQQSS